MSGSEIHAVFDSSMLHLVQILEWLDLFIASFALPHRASSNLLSILYMTVAVVSPCI